jgi:hypothetical protein
MILSKIYLLRINLINLIARVLANLTLNIQDSYFKNEIRLNPNNMKHLTKGNTKEILFNNSHFINLCHLVLNINDALQISENFNLFSITHINLNQSKAFILEMFTRLMDKLNQYNLIDDLDVFSKYLKGHTIELIKQYSQVNTLFTEKPDNIKGEEIMLKYFVKVLDYFNISIISRVSLSTFSENCIE